MGWLSDAWSSVKSSVSSAWDTAKNVAGKAIEWLAEKGEAFVGSIKKAWAVVKPYVSQISAVLKAGATAAAASGMPWLSGALLALDKGLIILTAFENSPIAKKIDAAIKWSIELAKRWQSAKTNKTDQETLTDEELILSKRHQENFRFAEREVVSEEIRHELELASAINDFEIARTDLANVIKTAPKDFEHYLRLRATQKLLGFAEAKFRTAKTVEELSADDLFVVRIASDLIKENPELTATSAERLDRLLIARYGKKLTPFIFEELIASWAKRGESLETDWRKANQEYAKNNTLLKRLTVAKNIQNELASEEESELTRLEIEVPSQKQKLDALAIEQQDVMRYVGAAEGFLQLLEKSEEEIEREGRDYLIEEGSNVGRLLIDCAEHGKAFQELSADEQSIITDYANIFGEEATMRAKTILEVAA